VKIRFEDADLQAEFDAVGRRAVIAALVVLSIFGSIVGACFLLGLSPERVVAVSTIAFQVGTLSYALFFLVPFFLRSMLMSYQSIRLGSKANENLGMLQNDLKPVISDLRDVIKDSRKDVDSLHELSERIKQELDGQGKLHKIAEALDKLSKTDFDGVIMEKIDTALGDVYGGNGQAEEEKEESRFSGT